MLLPIMASDEHGESERPDGVVGGDARGAADTAEPGDQQPEIVEAQDTPEQQQNQDSADLYTERGQQQIHEQCFAPEGQGQAQQYSELQEQQQLGAHDEQQQQKPHQEQPNPAQTGQPERQEYSPQVAAAQPDTNQCQQGCQLDDRQHEQQQVQAPLEHAAAADDNLLNSLAVVHDQAKLAGDQCQQQHQLNEKAHEQQQQLLLQNLHLGNISDSWSNGQCTSTRSQQHGVPGGQAASF
eukprot:GHUV01015284.1.p2 GENE.GHUV01015284.1~~GHUV01015284.1.p2  ORF type:complete len:239 (+),score=105.97 GHUV01015284.1:272-988(+)